MTRIAIVGPTASGKSALAMQVAQYFNGQIIAADSRTVYKGLDIGTAKPSPGDQLSIKHYMVDVSDWSEPMTAAEFKSMAQAAVTDIEYMGARPIMVGGSGLYVNSVLYNYQFKPPADKTFRQQLEGNDVTTLQAMLDERGIEKPQNSRNRRYLARTLEVGEPTTVDKQDKWKLDGDWLVIGLWPDKDKLRQRVIERAHAMIEMGVVNEAAQAYNDYPPESEALKSTIYRALKPYLEGDQTLDEALDAMVAADLRFAKKQYTWFKRDPNIKWFTNADEAYKFIVQQLS